MTMPTVVTLISALIGNILGYTSLKEVCAGMYYGSYSLPTYVTVWNAEAFVETTVVAGDSDDGGQLPGASAEAGPVAPEVPAA